MSIGAIAGDVLLRSKEILFVPFSSMDQFWAMAPVILSTALLAVYAGRYKTEEGTWNNAFGNGLMLVFVCVSLLKFQSRKGVLFQMSIENLLIGITILFGAVLLFGIFFHVFPKHFITGLASDVNIGWAVILISALINGEIILDVLTGVSAFILSVGVLLVIKVIQLMEPEPVDDDSDY